ncbi:hypothetical protein AB0L40_09745 [Patulibacter sp. NPDC049589]|uniref:hypothetical protein n=1 Tax=Patulibacter sp. NPDC049589 TaxID=3154731 RepID=UPI0034302E65
MFVSFHRFHGLDPARIQPTIDALEGGLLPAAGEESGCLNRFVLVDRPGGCVTGVTLWDNEAWMIASDQRAARDRAELAPDEVVWRDEPQVERHEIVRDEHRILALGAAALAA